jgi:catechol 2,3-dioxygenase-like lactoylglutathione lyase family enzyme
VAKCRQRTTDPAGWKKRGETMPGQNRDVGPVGGVVPRLACIPGGGMGTVAASLDGKTIGAITLFVEDLATTRAFYRTVFEREPVFEDDVSCVFPFGDTIINLLQVSEAPGLIGPAQVAGPEAGSRMQFTIWVDDADATVAGLAGKGVALVNGPIDRPWGVRTAAFADPAGHIWEIAQPLRGS